MSRRPVRFPPLGRATALVLAAVVALTLTTGGTPASAAAASSVSSATSMPTTFTGDLIAGEANVPAVGAWPDGATFVHEFYLDGVVYVGNDDGSVTYPLDAIGKLAWITTTASVPGGEAEVVVSEPVTVRGRFSSAPVVRIDGKPAVGARLAVGVVGGWGAATAVAYRWLNNGAVVGTGATYDVRVSDLNDKLVVEASTVHPNYLVRSAASTPVTVTAGTFSVAPQAAVSGAPRVGVVVTAKTVAPQPSAALAYVWKIDGVVVGTAASFTPSAAQVGKKLTLAITAKRDGFTSATSSIVTAPIAAGVFSSQPKPAVSGAVRVGAPVTAAPGTWKPGATFRYLWKVEGKAVSTAKAFTPAVAHKGRALTLTVTASTPGYASVTQTTAKITVGAGQFTKAPVPVIAGSTKVGSKLTVKLGTWSPSGAATYQWLRNGAKIPKATKSSYALTSADWNKKITVTVTVKRDGYSSAVRTSKPTGTVTKPFSKTTKPTVSGTTRVYSTLTAKVTAWAPAAKHSYQWKRNGVAISGATAQTYKLVPADLGTTITVSVKGTGTALVAATTTSAGTTKIAQPKPSLSRDGVYKVGTEIRPGTYVATVSASAGCYWERRSAAGSSFAGIISNDFISYTGRVIVTIGSGDKYFSSERCGAWTRYVPKPGPKASFGDGMFGVGVHLKPGVYRNSNSSGGCYWERLSGFGGSIVHDVIENEFTYSRSIVEISSSDVGFLSNRCGTWTRIG